MVSAGALAATEPDTASVHDGERGRRRSPTRARPQIPDHHLLRLIGSGSYGEVWLARNVLGTARAVKVVWRKDFQHDRPYDREFDGIRKYEPLSREHEGLVDILQLGRNDREGFFYYIMELADNAGTLTEESSGAARSTERLGSLSKPEEVAQYKPRTLREVMRLRGQLTPGECLDIGARLAAALEHLHRAELVHRDIKPSNIIFVDGRPKLADIGLVAGIDEAASFVGTEGFVPPEGPGTPPADIFSLGKVLYEMSTGMDRNEFPRLPAGGLWLHEGDAATLAELNEITLRACEPKSAQRYQDAAELRTELTLLQTGKSVRRLRRLERRVAWLSRAGLAAGIVALLALGAYFGSIKQIHRARRAEAQATERLSRLQRQKAEEFLANDQTGEGLAYLARVVREHPDDHAATERLLAALSWRGFTLPLAEPIRSSDRPDAVCFSPYGREFLIGTSTGNLEYRAFPTGERMGTPLKVPGRVVDARFSPDGRRVAIVSRNSAVVLDRATGESLTPYMVHDGRVKEVRFSPQGDRLVTCARDETARLWDAQTGRQVGASLRHSGYVRSAEFSPDGQLVATAGFDHMARIWDAHTGQPHTIPLEHDAGVSGANFSPDGTRLVTASDDQTARIWDVSTGKSLRVLCHRGAVRVALFSPDGQRIVTGSEDCTAQLWDASSGEPLGQPMRHRGWITCVEFSPDGQRVLTGSDDNTVRVWDAFSGKPASEPLRHRQEIGAAHFSNDGRAVISSGKDQVVCIWQSAASQARAIRLQVKAPAVAARFSPCGNLLAVACADGFLRVWRTSDLLTVQAVRQHGAPLTGLAFSSDGGRLVTTAKDNTARVWDLSTFEPLTPPLPHPKSIESARLSADGLLLVTGCDDGRARVWNVATGKLTGPVFQHEQSVSHAEFDPSGRKLLTTSTDDQACLWDLDTGEKVHTWLHAHSVAYAEFSHDGRRVVTASVDRTAKVWDVGTGLAVGRPMAHDSDVVSAHFSAGGWRVVTASRDRTARVWDTATGEAVSEVLLHEDIVRTACLSPDGRRVLTSSEDGTARLWDAETGLPLSDPFRHLGPVKHAEFSPYDGMFLTVSISGEVHIYEVFSVEGAAPSWLPDLAETVGGKRLNQNDLLEITRPESLYALMRRLPETPAMDFFGRWVKWFMDESAARTLMPSSSITLDAHFRHLSEEGSLGDLRAALSFAPTNASIYARLARRLVSDTGVVTPQILAEAEWCAQRAVALAPGLAEAAETAAFVREKAARSSGE